MTADYNSSSNSILDQNQLQSNGINTPPNLYMSTGVGGGKKRKSQKGNKNGIKKEGIVVAVTTTITNNHYHS